MWEDSHNSGTPTDKPRLLVLSENYELLIYEFDLKDGRCDGTILYNYSEETLQKLIEDQNISKFWQVVFQHVEICDITM